MYSESLFYALSSLWLNNPYGKWYLRACAYCATLEKIMQDRHQLQYGIETSLLVKGKQAGR